MFENNAYQVFGAYEMAEKKLITNKLVTAIWQCAERTDKTVSDWSDPAKKWLKPSSPDAFGQMLMDAAFGKGECVYIPDFFITEAGITRPFTACEEASAIEIYEQWMAWADRVDYYNSPLHSDLMEIEAITTLDASRGMGRFWLVSRDPDSLLNWDFDANTDSRLLESSTGEVHWMSPDGEKSWAEEI